MHAGRNGRLRECGRHRLLAALVRVAERNLDLFRARTGRRFASRIYTMDAADYAFTRDDTVVYLFNPFDAGVLSAVLARLRQSLATHPRRVWIV